MWKTLNKITNFGSSKRCKLSFAIYENNIKASHLTNVFTHKYLHEHEKMTEVAELIITYPNPNYALADSEI